MRLTAKLCLVLILLFLASPVILLKGCGNEMPQAPDGSTITISPSSTGDISCGTSTTPLVIPYGVTVKDVKGIPLNGVQVTISGGWALPFVPTLYTFSTDPAGSPAGYQPSPVKGVTNEYGVYSFSAVIPCEVLMPLATPVNGAFASATTGGTLSGATSYCYRVSAFDATPPGETLASNETCITTATGTNTNTVVVNWGAVSGAAGYNIYGNTIGAEVLIGIVLTPTVTFTDTGAAAIGGAPPLTNTSLATVTNSFIDTIYVSSGTAFATSGISFNP